MDRPITWLLKATLWAYVAGGFAGLLCLRREKLANGLAFGAAAAAGAAGLLAAVLFLAGGAGAERVELALLPSLIPYVRFAVRLDALSAFFLLIVSALGLALSIYSFGYVRGCYGRKNVGVVGAFYDELLL